VTPYYQDDAVTIYHGDAHDLAGGLLHGVERIITDPPYGTNAYPTDRAPDLSHVEGWVAASNTAAFFGYPETLAIWCLRLGRHPSEWVTWWPTNKQSARSLLLPRESEHVAVFGEVCGAQRLFRPRSADSMTRRIAEARGNDQDECRLGDVWRDPSPGAGFNAHLRHHVNEKPLSLMARLVELCSNAGDTIIDPFAGSGTTLRAAKDLGRKAVGVELEELYCEIAAKRCAQEVLPLEDA